MSKVKYVECAVKTGVMVTSHISVPVWEVPVLQSVHDTNEVQNVTIIGEKWVNRDEVDPAEEYNRLSRRYKTCKQPDGSPGPEHVAQVYGARQIGVNALANAIRSGVIKPAKVVVPAGTVEQEGDDGKNFGEKSEPQIVKAKRKRATKAEMLERIAKANADRVKGETLTEAEAAAVEGLLG